MNIKEFLKPTKGKIILSIVVTIVWYILLSSIKFSCLPCQIPEVSSCNVEWPKIFASCDCCFTFNDFFSQLLTAFVGPFVVTYISYSLISWLYSLLRKL
jgi:hypothetical protein